MCATAPEVEKERQGRWFYQRFTRNLSEFAPTQTLPYHDARFAKEKTLILFYCASGGRSARAGKVLKDMGYDRGLQPRRVQRLGRVRRGNRPGRCVRFVSRPASEA